MMNRYQRWLGNEIALWRDEGLVTGEQALLLEQRYAVPHDPGWGKMIFSALGAVIFGLGVILLLAYNWDGMGRFLKLGLILGSVALAHAAAFRLSSRGNHPKISESLHLLGTMFFGAGIWLVAQIYHIDEHYPNAFLVWALGSLLLAWTIPSLAHTLLAMVLLALWHSAEVFQFNHINHWATWIVAFGIIPQAWLRRSRVTILFAATLLAYSYAASVAGLDAKTPSLVFGSLFAIAITYVVASRIALGTAFPMAMSALRIVGFLLYGTLLFLLSIEDFSEDVFKPKEGYLGPLEWFYGFLPWLTVAGMFALLLLRYPETVVDRLERAELGLIGLVLVLVFLLSFHIVPAEQVSWHIFSLLFLAQSLLLIWRGTQQLRWQSATLGSVMLSAFVFARFLDLFQSLLMRSLAFLILGAALFAVGFYYSNQKHRQGGR